MRSLLSGRIVLLAAMASCGPGTGTVGHACPFDWLFPGSSYRQAMRQPVYVVPLNTPTTAFYAPPAAAGCATVPGPAPTMPFAPLSSYRLDYAPVPVTTFRPIPGFGTTTLMQPSSGVELQPRAVGFGSLFSPTCASCATTPTAAFSNPWAVAATAPPPATTALSPLTTTFSPVTTGLAPMTTTVSPATTSFSPATTAFSPMQPAVTATPWEPVATTGAGSPMVPTQSFSPVATPSSSCSTCPAGPGYATGAQFSPTPSLTQPPSGSVLPPANGTSLPNGTGALDGPSYGPWEPASPSSRDSSPLAPRAPSQPNDADLRPQLDSIPPPSDPANSTSPPDSTGGSTSTPNATAADYWSLTGRPVWPPAEPQVARESSHLEGDWRPLPRTRAAYGGGRTSSPGVVSPPASATLRSEPTASRVLPKPPRPADVRPIPDPRRESLWPELPREQTPAPEPSLLDRALLHTALRPVATPRRSGSDRPADDDNGTWRPLPRNR